MKTKLFIIGVSLFSLMEFDSLSQSSLKNEVLVKTFIEAWNDHNTDKLTSLFAEQCLYEVMADGGSFSSRQQIAAYAKSTFSGIPDTEMVVLNILTNDSTGVVEWIWKGTNSVGWPNLGLPATNKRFQVRGITIMKIENGLIKHNRDYWDWNTFIKGISK